MEDAEPTKGKLCVQGLVIHWRLIVLIVWPFLCSLVFIVDTTLAVKCSFVVLIMAGYWVCEVLPLGITGLLPIALFPALDILDTKTTATVYLNNTTVMFMCSLFIAFAIESSNLHRRIAMKTILVIGTTHLRLTFGFMFVTMFVSMWIINTAATAMMAPVVTAVLTELEENDLGRLYRPPRDKTEEEVPYPSRTTCCYFFGIAYASTIGGVGTLIGTGTNLTFKGIFEERFPDGPKVDFASWMFCMVPMMLLMTFLTWMVLSWQYIGLFRNSGMDEELRRLKVEDPEGAKEAARIARVVVQQKYQELGHVTWGEVWVIILFLLVVALWVTRDPTWMHGWAPQLSSVKTLDASPGSLVVIILFAIPMFPSCIYCLSKDPEKRPTKQEPGILSWDVVKSKMMWGLLFLLGGGFAIAKGSNESGMSHMIGEGLVNLKVLPVWITLFLVCLTVSIVTNFTANVAIANVILPVLSEMALVIGINPTYLMLPATVCCSFAFMLPVGTPPNALIAGFANIRTKDMIITGILPTLITLLVIVALFPTYGSIIYPDLNEYPEWAESKNETGK